MNEITLEALNELKEEYLIIDIREESAYAYGHIPNAIHLPAPRITEADFSHDKTLILCSRSRLGCEESAQTLTQMGYVVYSLKGGYFEWLRRRVGEQSGGEVAQKAEQSIRTKYHKRLFSKFARAIVTYKLVSPNDKIAVCISGGKDSMLLAKLFQEIKRHNKFPYELVFLVMDPGYSKENREIIERNAKALNIPITVFQTDIFENVFTIEKSPCYLCARMRRGHLYAKAKELGCNKIALGHHYDDVIETILMGMLYGGQVQTMMPKINSSNFEGMQLIRPMYLIREKDIKAWRDDNGLQFIQCACKFTEQCAQSGCETEQSKRLKVKKLIQELARQDPEIEQNIFKSVENVNLSTIIAYKTPSGERHSVLDDLE